MRPNFAWRLRSRTLALGQRTLVMGVVNVTPDSFSDGGLYVSAERAIEHALRLVGEGADILDIGGESTRPGAGVGTTAAVSAQQESDRILPVIEGVRRARPDAIVSVDTYKARVARAAVVAGAEIVNDVSAGLWDAAMPHTLAQLGCGAVLMHTRGRPDERRKLPPVADMVALVKRDLADRARAALDAGIARERIVLDPGFGFGKNFEENYPLLARFADLRELGYPLLAGTSRKSFIGRALARDGKDLPASERLYGSLAAATMTMLAGAHIVRAHDVAATVQAARVVEAALSPGLSS